MADESYARRFLREHAHYTEDIPFWRAAAQELGSPVLDLGAAAGRVALPLARDGAEVWALDASPAMLAELRRGLAGEPAEVAGRVHAVEGDLRSFSLGRRFALVMMAMNTFQVLLTPKDQLACLARVREHLASPDGELVFDVMLPDPAEIAGSLGLVRRTGIHWTQDGATLVHSAWYESFDPIVQTLAFTIQVDERDQLGGVARHLRRFTVHLFHPTEIHHLLARAGLEVVEAYGDFAHGPVEPSSERQIYRSRAAT